MAPSSQLLKPLSLSTKCMFVPPTVPPPRAELVPGSAVSGCSGGRSTEDPARASWVRPRGTQEGFLRRKVWHPEKSRSGSSRTSQVRYVDWTWHPPQSYLRNEGTTGARTGLPYTHCCPGMPERERRTVPGPVLMSVG